MKEITEIRVPSTGGGCIRYSGMNRLIQNWMTASDNQ